jgi:type IV pilus assembly protein PilC
MEYRCRVATASGQIMEATYVAESEARLRLELEEKGLFLLSVQGKGGFKLGGLQLRLPRRRKVPNAEFIIFNQELATLLKAGLPVVQSLDILRKRVPNPLFKATLDDVYEKVRSGSALSEAFEAQKLFSGVYTASLMAGEKSGSLETVIRRYVQHVKVIASVRSKVVSALIYPAVLVGLSIAVVGLIVFKVVPEFASFYSQEGNGAQLPLSTRIVVAISTTAVSSGGFIVAGIVAAVILGILWFRQPSQRTTPGYCGCRTSDSWPGRSRPLKCRERWRRCCREAFLSSIRSTSRQSPWATGTSPGTSPPSPGRSAREAAWRRR